ncbi:hypothetical protein [Saccharothrix australiensis]|nr:hypothetical protein [Saccharothrix australiensis]
MTGAASCTTARRPTRSRREAVPAVLVPRLRERVVGVARRVSAR